MGFHPSPASKTHDKDKLIEILAVYGTKCYNTGPLDLYNKALHCGTTAMLRAIEKTDVLRPVLQNFFTVTNIFTTLV